MAVENGEWIMRGPDRDNPACIRSWETLVDWIDLVGFLPLFRNGIEGFSAEEHTCPFDWWCGDADRDPWEWRQIIARSGRVAYGKFFGGGTDTTSTAAGRTNWPPLARKRSWTNSLPRMSGSPST